MKSLFDTRTFVYETFAQYCDKEASRIMENSILLYTKQLATTKFNMKQLRWSDVRLRRLYLRKFRMMMANMATIQKMVQNNTLSFEQSAFVDHQYLQPDLYQPFIEAKQKRELLSQLVDSDEKHDGILQCEQCRNFKTRYTELQTRGADEPMTVFAMCLDCDHHWTLTGK